MASPAYDDGFDSEGVHTPYASTSQSHQSPMPQPTSPIDGISLIDPTSACQTDELSLGQAPALPLRSPESSSPPSPPSSPPTLSPPYARRPTSAEQDDRALFTSTLHRRLAEAKEVWPQLPQNHSERAIREEERSVLYLVRYSPNANERSQALGEMFITCSPF